MLEKKFKEIDKDTNLNRAQRVQTLMDREISFCYREIDAIIKDLYEEIDELKEELKINNNKKRIGEELGDVIFVLCNLANYFDIKAEDCINSSVNEFERRFLYIENKLNGADMGKVDRNKLDELWKEAKNTNSKLF